MMQSGDWTATARFASYSCQCDALHLQPHQTPPSELNDDYHPADDYDPGLGRREAHRLLQKMRGLGVSKYHPDPLAAIAEVEAMS